MIAAKRYSWTARDVDPRMVGIAMKRANCDFLIGDATDLPFKESFDLVVGVGILDHIENRNRLPKSSEES